MRAPVDRVATFDELVDENLAELADSIRARPLLDRDEDFVLDLLADLQRRHGRSPRLDAFVAACWLFWTENSVHASRDRREAS